MKMYIIAAVSILLIGAGYYYQSNNHKNLEGTSIENDTAINLSNQLREGAPIQNAVKQAVANGTLSLQDMDGEPEYSRQILIENKSNIKIKYTTKIKFKNPKGAGISSNKWPKFQINFTTSTNESNIANESNGSNISTPNIANESNGSNISIPNIANESNGSNISIPNIANESNGSNISTPNIANESNGSNISTPNIANESNLIDYDQAIKDSITTEIENITNGTDRMEINDSWNNYSFESGPRTYEINETYDGTYLNNSNYSKISTQSTYDYYILMGFTRSIHWQYSKEENFYIPILWWNVHIAWVRANAEIDAAIGLRLPTKVGLNVPNQMASEQSYTLSTNIIGQDWNTDQYFLANVPSENGNEFVLRGKFSISAQAWVKVIGNIGPYGISKDLDYGRSFKTPFGDNEKFPIPELVYSPDQTGLKFYFYNNILWAGIGLKIEPILGSNKITAKWDATGDSTGNGLIEYDNPNINYSFGEIKAGSYDDNNNYAIIKLSDYNYYFNICKLDFDANVQGGLTILPITIQTPYVTIYSYDCGRVFRWFWFGKQEAYLGIHPGTNKENVTKIIEVFQEKRSSAIPNSTINGTPTPTVNGTENITATPTPTVNSTPNSTVNGTENITATPTPTVNSTPNSTVNGTENITATPTPTVVNGTENITATPTPTVVNGTENITATPTPTVVNGTENITATPAEIEVNKFFMISDKIR